MKSTNNIDKLFADKLSGLESTPSADAWMTLEKGLQQKNKKKPFWLPYSVAAAVLVLILSGVLLLHNEYYQDANQGIAGKPTIQENSGNLAQENKPAIQQAPAVKQDIEATEQIAQQPTIEQPVVSEKSSPAPTSEIAIAEKKEVKALEQIKSVAPEKAPAISKQPEGIRQLPAIQETVVVHQKNSLPETTKALANSDANTIVVTVQLDEPSSSEESTEIEEPDSPAKQGKAARLLDKLRKLKKGEFNELGLNKQNLVALVKVNSNRSDRQDNSRE